MDIINYLAIMVAALAAVRAHYRSKKAISAVESSLKDVYHSASVAENMQKLAGSANEVLDRLTNALTKNGEEDYKNIARKLTNATIDIEQLQLQVDGLKESLRAHINKVNARERTAKGKSTPEQSGNDNIPQLTEEQMRMYEQQSLFEGGAGNTSAAPKRKQNPFNRIPRG